jgi:hypothetical protein
MSTHIKISTITVGAGGAASIDFASIPATYTDLVLVGSLRGGSGGAAQDSFGVRVNNDASSIYTNLSLYGNGSAAESGVNASVVYLGYLNTFIPVSGSTASTFGSFSLYLPNYTSANYKSSSLDIVAENNTATAYATLSAGLYASTSAINRLTIYDRDYSSFAEFSSATLYGIKSS